MDNFFLYLLYIIAAPILYFIWYSGKKQVKPYTKRILYAFILTILVGLLYLFFDSKMFGSFSSMLWISYLLSASISAAIHYYFIVHKKKK